jgi:hypothetical protein
MTLASNSYQTLVSAAPAPLRFSPNPSRVIFVLTVAIAAVGGAVAVDAPAAALAARAAGPELARLLRAMAALKVALAAPVFAAVLWRLGAPASPGRLLAYGLAGAAMAAGPGLIWSLAQLKLGALLLHGGLLSALVLLWRDGAVRERLSAAIASRRAVLALRGAPRPSAGR